MDDGDDDRTVDAVVANGAAGVAAPLLVHALEESRALGFLGARSIDEVVAHARHFVDTITAHVMPPPIGGSRPRVLDLGAGGGVPGLVIAHDLPFVQVTLLDRRRTRTDFLERVVRRLEWTDRVDVVTQDASRPASAQLASFDAVVARGFGPPLVTLRTASRWVRVGGMIAISEPPSGDRWAQFDIAEFGVERHPGTDRVATFLRR